MNKKKWILLKDGCFTANCIDLFSSVYPQIRQEIVFWQLQNAVHLYTAVVHVDSCTHAFAMTILFMIKN